MDYIQQLNDLLLNDVLLEVNTEVEAMQIKLDKKPTKAVKEELKYMCEVKKYFDEVIEDIKLGNLTQKDALDILEGLEDMKINDDEI